ncbi:MAG: hypothetical protein K2N25_07570 [Muribaculaceae bacterium]|nr:hypothetical protein [Muribaculaceae bacterium]
MNLRYLLSSVVVCAAVSVNAAQILDFGEMQPESVYDYELLVPVMGYYTPVESGILKSYCTGDEIGVYKDASHQEELFSQQSFYTASGEKARVYAVNKGETVYFYNPAPVAEGKFRFVVEKEQIELGDVDPSPDNVLSISSSYGAELAFNVSVKISKCKLEINGVSAEITPLVVDSRVTVNWFNTLRQWYRDGKINEGDILTMTLTGIRDEYDASNRPDFGDGPGKLILKYKMAGRPLELIRETGTPGSGAYDFLSYYLPGSDMGLVTLIFSGDLDPDCHPVAEIQYGDQDNIEAGMYKENPPVTVDRNMVTVNLQGVKRFPEEMVPGLAPLSSIALIISRIKGPDGQYVLTGNSSSPFSFGYSYNFKTVAYSIAADWVPVAGSLLKEGDNMEIWVLNGRQISFDSVDFSYLKDGVPAMVSVPYADLKVEQDEYADDALLYYLSAPALDSDPDSEINVTFGGLQCADGLDHSSDIFVRYKSSTSGVDVVEAADADAVYYDLAGRRVRTPSKGIYIRDGRKVIVK